MKLSLKKKVLLFVVVFVAFLQLLQGFAGGDLLLGYGQDSHYFNILNGETGQFGMTFKTGGIFISIPNPVKKLSYRIKLGKFIAWGTEGTLEERNICLLGYHFYPAKNTKTVRQCIGLAVGVRPGYVY